MAIGELARATVCLLIDNASCNAEKVVVARLDRLLGERD